MSLKRNTNGGQFDKDYNEILKKLKKLIQDSENIKRTAERGLDKDKPEQVMTLLRELIPQAIEDLGPIYWFLNKYGYNDYVEKIQENIYPKRRQPK